MTITISLISISSPLTVEQLSVVEQAKVYLDSLGINYVCNASTFNLEKKTAELRAQEFTNAYLDPDTDCVLSVRGGSGAIEILEHLNYSQLLTARAKPVLAYSDITTLSLAFARKAQDLNLSSLAFFHAPMFFEMGKCFHRLNRNIFENFLEQLSLEKRTKLGNISNLRASFLNSSEQVLADYLSTTQELNLDIENAGFEVREQCQNTSLQISNYLKVTQILRNPSNNIIGANLSVLCSLLGTSFMPSFKGKILFIEDCNEPLYKMERMFYQLHLAGCFDNLKELWIGTSSEAELPMDLILRFSEIHGFTFVCDLPIGHGDLNFITPLF